MTPMEKLYWKIRYAFENLYFKVRYGRRSPGIYYDRMYKLYVNPEIIEERGSLYWVLSESVRDNLIYRYRIGSEITHDHDFESVMQEAYENRTTFSIPEEYLHEYSEQELSFLDKITQLHRSPEQH